MDDDTISLIAQGKLFLAHLERRPGAHGVELNDEATARELLRSLLPITSIRPGTLPADTVDYEFTYQSGSHPICFEIDVSHDHLLFQAGTWVYGGANTEVFESLANKVLKRPGKEKVTGTPRSGQFPKFRAHDTQLFRNSGDTIHND